MRCCNETMWLAKILIKHLDPPSSPYAANEFARACTWMWCIIFCLFLFGLASESYYLLWVMTIVFVKCVTLLKIWQKFKCYHVLSNIFVFSLFFKFPAFPIVNLFVIYFWISLVRLRTWWSLILVWTVIQSLWRVNQRLCGNGKVGKNLLLVRLLSLLLPPSLSVIVFVVITISGFSCSLATFSWPRLRYISLQDFHIWSTVWKIRCMQSLWFILHTS